MKFYMVEALTENGIEIVKSNNLGEPLLVQAESFSDANRTISNYPEVYNNHILDRFKDCLYRIKKDNVI